MTAPSRGPDQAWRVVVTAHAPSGSLPVIYDSDLGEMGLLLGIRIYMRPSFYEIRFAVAAPDMATAMMSAGECWDAAISALPLPAWEPHRPRSNA